MLHSEITGMIAQLTPIMATFGTMIQVLTLGLVGAVAAKMTTKLI